MIVVLFGVRSGVIIVTALAAMSVASIACQPPAIEGTTYAKGKKNPHSSNAAADEDEDEDATETAEDPPTSGTPTKSNPPDAGQIAPPVPTTTTPPPPPVTHPNCQSDDPLSCLDCCLGANPQAVAFEVFYEDCITGCFDSACDQQCHNQHVTGCAGNAACAKNHACMEANNCLSQNFCD